MQHKNPLILAAVAAALAASASANAEVDVYGKIHTSVASVSQDDGVNSTSATEVKSNASRFGIKSSKKLENGVEFKGQFEFEVDAAGDTQASSTDLVKLRNTYVGLKGSFGEVRIGNHDTPHKTSTAKLDVFGDTYADYNNIIQNDHRVGNAILYMNSFGPVGVAAAYAAGDDSVTAENNGNITSVMLNYSSDALYLTAASETFADTVAGDIENATKFGLGYDFGAFDLGLVHEILAIDGGDDQTESYISAKFKLDDKNTIKAAYGMRDDGVSGNDDPVMSAIGIDHKMDKQATIYALYAAGTDGGLSKKGKLAGDSSAVSLGFVYKF